MTRRLRPALPRLPLRKEPALSAPISAPAFDLSRVSRRAALLGGGAAALAGCTPLGSLSSAIAAPDLYRLTPKSDFDPDLPLVRLQIVVDEPTASAAVNTDGIAVRPNPWQVEYYPDSRWVDRAPLMVQTLLYESFDNSERAPAIARRATGLAADLTLLTELREFQAELEPLPEGADPAEAGPPVVSVRMNMKLVREPRGLIVAVETFSRRVRAADGDILSVVAAFDDALGKCMRRAVRWTLQEAAALDRRR